jgi:hypothetical protein
MNTNDVNNHLWDFLSLGRGLMVSIDDSNRFAVPCQTESFVNAFFHSPKAV